jgi:hypothetical protein
MIRAGLPEGSDPKAPRRRRARRSRAPGTITAPPIRTRAKPSVAPVETSEPALLHRAAFWTQGPGAGAGEREVPSVLCMPSVLGAAAWGMGAAALINGAQATRTRRPAPIAIPRQRHTFTVRGYKPWRGF